MTRKSSKVSLRSANASYVISLSDAASSSSSISLTTSSLMTLRNHVVLAFGDPNHIRTASRVLASPSYRSENTRTTRL